MRRQRDLFCCYPDACGCDDGCCRGADCNNPNCNGSTLGKGACCSCDSNAVGYAWPVQIACPICVGSGDPICPSCGTNLYFWTTSPGSPVVAPRVDTGPAQGSGHMADFTQQTFLLFAPLAQGIITGMNASTTAPQPPLPLSLTATPNPVPAGSGYGSTTITFSTGDGSVGQVWVSEDGLPEALFAQGAGHSQLAPWIGSGSTYVFTLYQGTTHSTVLRTVTVTRLATGSVVANPNPVPAGEGYGTTTIAWSISGNNSQVWVSANGGGESKFAEGVAGSADAPWIQTGWTYEFSLYAGTTHTQWLDSVTVTREDE